MSSIDYFRQTGVEFSKVQVLCECLPMMTANSFNLVSLIVLGKKNVHSAFILNTLNVFIDYTLDEAPPSHTLLSDKLL